MLGKTKLVAVLMMIGLAVGMYTATSAPGASAAGPSAEKEAAVGATATESYKNEAYGYCLDGTLETADGFPCDTSAGQDWTVTKWGDGTVRLKNADTGECLSDGGGTLGTSATCTTSRAQSFFVDRWADGTIRFRNQSSGQCVNMADPGPAGGYADVGSTKCNTSEAQSWY